MEVSLDNASPREERNPKGAAKTGGVLGRGQAVTT